MNYFRGKKSKVEGEGEESSDHVSDLSDDGKKENDSGKKKDKDYYKNLFKQEKEGKRKLFHALTKLVKEIKTYKEIAGQNNQAWYEGGKLQYAVWSTFFCFCFFSPLFESPSQLTFYYYHHYY